MVGEEQELADAEVEEISAPVDEELADAEVEENGAASAVSEALADIIVSSSWSFIISKSKSVIPQLCIARSALSLISNRGRGLR